MDADTRSRIATQRELNQRSIEKAERFLLWSGICLAQAAFTSDRLRAALRDDKTWD